MPARIIGFAPLFLVACSASPEVGADAPPPSPPVPTITAAIEPPAASSVPLAAAPAPTTLTIAGTVKGSLPADTVLAVLWHMPSGKTRMFLAARGTARGDSFTITLPRGPEPEQVIRGTLGVGILVALQPETRIPEGGLDRAAFEALTDRLIGAAPRQAIVFRGERGELLDRVPWLKEFEPGLHCGRGIPPAAGATHEGFAPIACDTFEIVIGPFSELNGDFVDWT